MLSKRKLIAERLQLFRREGKGGVKICLWRGGRWAKLKNCYT